MNYGTVLLGALLIVSGYSAKASSLQEIAPRTCQELDSFIANPQLYVMIVNEKVDALSSLIQLGYSDAACSVARDIDNFYKAKNVFCRSALIANPDENKSIIYNSFGILLEPKIQQWQSINNQLSCFTK